MHEVNCEGILLRTIDYREADRLAIFLTDHEGRLALRAPGARKSKRRFVGMLESFSHLRIAYRRPRHGFPTLVRLEPISLHTPIREELSAFAAVSYASELVLSLTHEGDPNPALFSLFQTFVTYCEEHSPLSPKALCRFHLRLLQVLGLQPDWYRCLECGKELTPEHPFFFELAQGGLLCQSCPPSNLHGLVALTEPIRQLMLALHHRTSMQASTQDWKRVVEVLDRRIHHLLGKKTKSREFLREMVDF